MTTETKRRKKQPTAAAMREQLVLAANEIIQLRAQLYGIEYSSPSGGMKRGVYAVDLQEVRARALPQPWWRRMFRRRS